MLRTGLVAVLVLWSQAPATAADRFVSTGGNDGPNNCSSSVAPCRSVAHALLNAGSGDIVKITSGRYPSNILIHYTTTVTLSGGWTYDFAQQLPSGQGPRTRLDGGRRDRVLNLATGAGEVLNVTVEHLTIQGGYSTSTFGTTGYHGGGVIVEAFYGGSTALTLRDVTLKKNSNRQYWSGGAIGLVSELGGLVTLDAEDTIFLANTAERGGAIDFVGGSDVSISLKRCVMKGNSSRFRGGAIGVEQYIAAAATTLELDDCLIEKSGTPNEGSAIYLNGAVDATIVNTVIRRLQSGDGAIYLASTSPAPPPVLELVNSTITRRSVSAGTNGVVVSKGTANITNSILWPLDANLIIFPGSVVNLDHSDVSQILLPGGTGTLNDLGGNISTDPLFVRPDEKDVHLTAGSPCVDAGTCVGAPAVDFDGDARPVGGQCDIGADEYTP